MRRRVGLAIGCAIAGSLAVVPFAGGGLRDQTETVLPTPPVEAVGKAATPWMRTFLRRPAALPGPLAPAARPHATIAARLRTELPGGTGRLWFLTYRSRAGRLCGMLFESDPSGPASGGGTGGLPCYRGLCAAICAGSGIQNYDDRWFAYSATVPAASDALRLTMADGSRFRFSLVGPRVRGALGRRVVLAFLPTTGDVVLVEALRADEVIASQSYSS
jgi:hypothetical protein